MSCCHDMNEIEIEHQCYCPETGMFCQFMDHTGYCIATNCRHIWNWIEQKRIEEQHNMSEERCWAVLDMLNRQEEKYIYGTAEQEDE